MIEQMKPVRIGLFLVMLTLIFGIGLGVTFGVAEDSIKSYISDAVAENPEVHDDESNKKIWRYAQRAHFHATGIAAFSIGLILLIMFSSLTRKLKTTSSILVGLGGFYPLSWFAMFFLAQSIGGSAAHGHIVPELLAYIGVGGLLLGIAILCGNIFLGMFHGDGDIKATGTS